MLLGGALAVIAFLIFAPRMQPWIQVQLSKTEKREKAVVRVQGLSDRHGAFGVGFIAPFLIGLLISAGVGVVLDLPRKKLGFYLVLVVLVWAIGLAVLATAMYQGRCRLQRREPGDAALLSWAVLPGRDCFVRRAGSTGSVSVGCGEREERPWRREPGR